jgi:Resolvase, N terminal domain
MAALLIGYARCSTDQQDLTAQRDGLAALGVAVNRVYVDHGLTGTNGERPGLREALAACHPSDAIPEAWGTRSLSSAWTGSPAPCRTSSPWSLTYAAAAWASRACTRPWTPRPQAGGSCSTSSPPWPNSLLSGHAEMLASPMWRLLPGAVSTGEGGRCARGQGS